MGSKEDFVPAHTSPLSHLGAAHHEPATSSPQQGCLRASITAKWTTTMILTAFPGSGKMLLKPKDPLPLKQTSQQDLWLVEEMRAYPVSRRPVIKRTTSI